MLRMALLVACSAVLSLTLQAGELVDGSDRFTQKRELKWISHVTSETPAELGLTASIVFSVGESPSGALVHLAGSFDGLKYASCHMTHWLADGVPVKPASNSYQVLPRKNSVRSIEIVSSVFTITQLKQLASAQAVEYRLCRDEGRVPAEDHAGLRELVSKL